MLPEGSKLFWTHERIEEFIARTASESAKKPPSRPGEATDLSAYILELGRHNGFTADEVRLLIGKWMEVARKDVTDFRRQGMVAFAEKNFRLAGENFRRSAEEMEQQAAKNLRASAADRELSGDAFFNARDYRQALQQYRHTLTLLKTYKDSLGPLGIKTYPEHTVDVQRITLKSANAKIGLGEQVAGPDSRRHLEEAVREYLGLIAQVPRSSDPRQWAMTQNNLGNAFWRLGERLGGPEGLRRLSEAVEAYRQALTVRTRDDLPQDWAMTQNNLGTASSRLRSVWAVSRRVSSRSTGSRRRRASATTPSPRRPCGRSPSSATSPPIRTPRRAVPSPAWSPSSNASRPTSTSSGTGLTSATTSRTRKPHPSRTAASPCGSFSTLSAATTRPRSWPGSRRSRPHSRHGPRNPRFRFDKLRPSVSSSQRAWRAKWSRNRDAARIKN